MDRVATEELTWLPAREIRQLIVGRELSAREVTESFLERIESLEPHLNAFQWLDPDAAILEAVKLDERLDSEDDPGPLWGVPFSVKDSFSVKGMPSTRGSLLHDEVATDDAIAVGRLRSAGAVPIGKTVMPEYGAWWQGLNRLDPRSDLFDVVDYSVTYLGTANPWDLVRTPGGSSSGAGASAAAAMVPVAIGSDGAGSIRMPAAFCGVFGFKPSSGRVPEGGSLGWPDFTVVGPMTRDVRDSALVMSVIAGFHRDDVGARRDQVPDYSLEASTMALNGLRIGRWAPELDSSDQIDVLECVQESITQLADHGALVEDLDVGLDVEEMRAVYNTLALAAFQRDLRSTYSDPRERAKLAPYTKIIAEMAFAVEVDEVVAALRGHRHFASLLSDCWVRFDAIVSPTVGFVAPPRTRDIDLSQAWPTTRYLFLANLCGVAAASIPAGFVNNLPVGLQVIAPPEREAVLFRLGRVLEELQPWSSVRPERHP